MNTKENNNGWKNRSKDNYNVERAQILEALIEQHTPKILKTVNLTMITWGIDNNHPICEREDLIQEGKLAVIKAYDSYQDDKNASLGTWIHNQIEWAVMEYMKANFTGIHGGQYAHNIARKLKNQGIEVNTDTLVEAGLSRRTAVAYLNTCLKPSSAGGASSGLRRKDDDELMKQPEKSYFQKEFEDCFRLEYEKYLDPKESKVLASYYGLCGATPKTMKEIGKDIGKSGKAVSYMIEKSLVKLRHQPGIEAYNIV